MDQQVVPYKMLPLFHCKKPGIRVEIIVGNISEPAGIEGAQSGKDNRPAINFIMLREF